ncbi:MAG: DNA polymerase III subunit chi [Rhodospirillales bacterium]|nr:DNA polymerase III subunit chi [Alphaproteobacteria bacterium]MCB9986762.1 DNA polymerase III subunit chi [Rhodospirillales bacterium]USO08467.1 MAG: DNA polymerase III subunit chi [Rhodospirillales bacterium]
MTEIRFYHLQRSREEDALPLLAFKAWQAGQRVVVRLPDAARVEAMNNALWTFKADAFLPHGSAADGAADRQPVWLSTENDNPNGAKTLILGVGCTPDEIEAYTLCCLMLDGNDAAQVEGARSLWRGYKDAGHELSYWQQDASGWSRKA